MNPTIQTYNQKGKKYDEGTVEFWEKFPKEFIDKFVELVKGKVLNVGSGPGRDGLLLKEKGLGVVCLDASETMVELCKERGLEAVLGDFKKIPFEKDYFGGVWAYTSLLHTPKSELSAAIGEIKRVLKEGGIFGLGMIEGEGEGYSKNSAAGAPCWFSLYTKKEMEEILQKEGFEILYRSEFKPSSKNYLNYIAKKS